MVVARVRAATRGDVDEILRIQRETWRTAYAELIPASAVDRLAGPAARRAWAAAVNSERGHLLVATEGEWTVGFCAASVTVQGGPENGPGDDAPVVDTLADADRAQIVTLLVEPRWGRRGHGRRLLSAAFEALAAGGARSGIVWLPERDLVSRAFYDRIGWDPDGGMRTLDAGDRELREIRLAGPLRVDNRDPRRRPEGMPIDQDGPLS